MPRAALIRHLLEVQNRLPSFADTETCAVEAIPTR